MDDPVRQTIVNWPIVSANSTTPDGCCRTNSDDVVDPDAELRVVVDDGAIAADAAAVAVAGADGPFHFVAIVCRVTAGRETPALLGSWLSLSHQRQATASGCKDHGTMYGGGGDGGDGVIVTAAVGCGSAGSIDFIANANRKISLIYRATTTMMDKYIKSITH